jgi:GTP 3',8-cyclase
MANAAPLIDSFGRVHTNLRISVTDRCNIRCFYCMPETDVQFVPRGEILDFEEIERFARIAAGLGIDKLRVTGGEPLLRRDLPELIRRLAAIPGIRDLALTTNGVLLEQFAAPLYEAGLRRLNVHIDTLDRERFRQITRRDDLPRVLAGLIAAKGAGFRTIKLKTLSREISPLLPVPDPDPRAPATEYEYADGGGAVGFIASVSRPFCLNCNRLRLTADGKLRYCLFAIDEDDVKAPLRSGASDAEIADLIRRNIAGKWIGHEINSTKFVPPPRPMYSIGG